MIRKFANPYIIFYPTVSRDGMHFPINKALRDIQGRAFKEEYAWRGNIIVAKYCDSPFTSMTDASMADFPILKNYFLTHGCPRQVGLYLSSIPPRVHKVSFTGLSKQFALLHTFAMLLLLSIMLLEIIHLYNT